MKVKSLHLGIAVRLFTGETSQFLDVTSPAHRDLDITFEQGIFWIRSRNVPNRVTCVTIQNVRSFEPILEVQEKPAKSKKSDV